MGKKAIVLAANGVEESELVITVDVLRRAEIDVTVAGVNGTEAITCSRNVKLVPDCSLESVQDNLYDAIILPGGLGATDKFMESELVGKVVKHHEANLKWICAICAAPLVLKKFQVGSYKYVTSHPGVKERLLTDSTFQYKEDRVVKDENFITSRGPGSAFEFALAICEVLVSKEKTLSVIKPLMLKADSDDSGSNVDDDKVLMLHQRSLC